MFLKNIFRSKVHTHRRQHPNVCQQIAEEIELSGRPVKVCCRVSCIGEGCPKPQLMTLKALNESPSGTVIEVLTDNPSAVETIPSMMDIYGGQHIATKREESCWRIYVVRDTR